MSYQVLRPTNGHVIAEFDIEHHYYYLFPDGCEVPLNVQYAWCHQCELFVEVEKLYSQQEIKENIDRLNSWKADWLQKDEEMIRIIKKLDGPVNQYRTYAQRFESWKSALGWFDKRKSTARCLECGSMTAIIVLPLHEVIPHPYGVGLIEIIADGDLVSIDLSDGIYFPPPIYFDEEGNRLSSADIDSVD